MNIENKTKGLSFKEENAVKTLERQIQLLREALNAGERWEAVNCLMFIAQTAIQMIAER